MLWDWRLHILCKICRVVYMRSNHRLPLGVQWRLCTFNLASPRVAVKRQSGARKQESPMNGTGAELREGVLLWEGGGTRIIDLGCLSDSANRCCIGDSSQT